MKNLSLSLLFLLSSCYSGDELQQQIDARKKTPIIEIHNQYTHAKIPKTKKSFIDFAKKQAKLHNLSLPRFLAQIEQESNYNPNAIGTVKEVGLGQIKLSTAQEHCAINTKKDLLNPFLNLWCSARIKANLKRVYNSEIKAEHHYNGGGRCVTGKCKQTTHYVKLIDQKSKKYNSAN